MVSRGRGPDPADAFGTGPEYTVGVEEELMLLDPSTLRLAPRSLRVVAAADDAVHVKPEVRQCMVEIASRPWSRSQDLLEDLAALRTAVLSAAGEQGCLVAGAGVHPFSAPEDQPTTPDARYLSIIEEVGYPQRRALVFGTHVHVAVGSADKAVQVTEALLPHLPLLIALGASSPFWRGEPNHLACNRLAVFADVPRTGLPPVFHRFADYTAALETLRRGGAVPDPSYVWWDVRCQARLGTIEVRAMDAQPWVRDTAALAGLVQALVRHEGGRWEEGHRTVADRFVVGENRWLAIRHGMAALLVGTDGHARPVPELVTGLTARLRADAEALGATWALRHVERLATGGTALPTMVEQFKRRGEIRDVVGWLVGRTARPGPTALAAPPASTKHG